MSKILRNAWIALAVLALVTMITACGGSIMDEPMAALGVRETTRVEELILRLRADGIAVLIISHNFDQVMRLSNQVWVMRSGRLVGGRRTSETSGTELVSMITGANEQQVLQEEFVPREEQSS